MIEIGHCLGDPDSIPIDETTTIQKHTHKHPHITCIQKRSTRIIEKHRQTLYQNNAYRVSIFLFFGPLLTRIHRPYTSLFGYELT